MSCIILSKRAYTPSRRSKHIPVRYFYSENVIEENGVTIEKVGTGDIMADGLTKPKQGQEYGQFKMVSSNYPEIEQKHREKYPTTMSVVDSSPVAEGDPGASLLTTLVPLFRECVLKREKRCSLKIPSSPFLHANFLKKLRPSPRPGPRQPPA